MRMRSVLLVIIGVGAIVSCGGGNPSAELQDVEAMVDELFTAFVAADPDAAVALFAEDGVWVDKNRSEWIGEARIATYVETVGPGLSRCERTGRAEATTEGSFVIPVEFTWRGVDYQDVAVLTKRDHLILRLDWQSQP